MNNLVEHLETHHNPNGNACIFVRVETIIAETGWTKEEIWELIKEPEKHHQLAKSLTGIDWTHEPTAKNLNMICVWNRIYWKGAGDLALK